MITISNKTIHITTEQKPTYFSLPNDQIGQPEMFLNTFEEFGVECALMSDSDFDNAGLTIPTFETESKSKLNRKYYRTNIALQDLRDLYYNYSADLEEGKIENVVLN